MTSEDDFGYTVETKASTNNLPIVNRVMKSQFMTDRTFIIID